MRYLRFFDDGRPALGRLQGDTIEVLDGGLFDAHSATGRRVPLAGVQLLPPVMPGTFYAAGVNYHRHLEAVSARNGVPFRLPDMNHIGYRANSALVGHGTPIVVPRDSSGRLQFEGELVVVIGKGGKHIAARDALSHVFGYTIGNDVSERQWQNADRTLWRAKNADTFKPMGPWIETDVDLDAMQTTVRLNGREVSRFKTREMVFGIEDTIAEISRYITLSPGDVIWMGTDEPTLDMVATDQVEVEIEGIGVLANRLVAE
jgi:2-keto-4-pentenoate hydratase/2-oxohepta-3-ene-1,7-dioic acid hydratase in catechol pathway